MIEALIIGLGCVVLGTLVAGLIVLGVFSFLLVCSPHEHEH